MLGKQEIAEEADGNVYGVDFDMGIDEYFYSGNWCFIEWPEKVPHLLPLDHASIVMRALPNGKRELLLKND